MMQVADCVGIVRLNSVNAVADTGTTDGYDTSQSCHETGQGVAEGQHVSGVDTDSRRVKLPGCRLHSRWNGFQSGSGSAGCT